jgi:hypothetical protein
MACGDCARWTAGSAIPFSDEPSTYGTCAPRFGPVPFWARRWQRDMSSRTRPDEGEHCAAFMEPS